MDHIGHITISLRYIGAIICTTGSIWFQHHAWLVDTIWQWVLLIGIGFVNDVWFMMGDQSVPNILPMEIVIVHEMAILIFCFWNCFIRLVTLLMWVKINGYPGFQFVFLHCLMPILDLPHFQTNPAEIWYLGKITPTSLPTSLKWCVGKGVMCRKWRTLPAIILAWPAWWVIRPLNWRCFWQWNPHSLKLPVKSVFPVTSPNISLLLSVEILCWR